MLSVLRSPGRCAEEVRVDTLIFIELLATAFLANRGAKSRVVVPMFVLGLVLVALVFKHHATSTLDLSF